MDIVVALPLIALAVALFGALLAVRALKRAATDLDAAVDRLPVTRLGPCSTSGRESSWSSGSSR